jgi:hypothetical protein
MSQITGVERPFLRLQLVQFGQPADHGLGVAVERFRDLRRLIRILRHSRRPGQQSCTYAERHRQKVDAQPTRSLSDTCQIVHSRSPASLGRRRWFSFAPARHRHQACAHYIPANMGLETIPRYS